MKVDSTKDENLKARPWETKVQSGICKYLGFTFIMKLVLCKKIEILVICKNTYNVYSE